MAIYRTGTASMTAAGVVTGVGTKWKDSLSLIRVGATIVFLTNPLNLATISAIVSDTELRVVTSDAAAVPAGTKYVILLHDSITVDGLAQDVAETLRYYQGKESEIADAIEFFETFDFDKLKVIGDQVKADATAAAQSKTAAAASQQAASQSQTAAAGSATTAGQARDQAQQANSAAQGAKSDAIAARDAAKQYADSVNPSLLLHSANNLNDVANKAQSLQNLQDGKPLPLAASATAPNHATSKSWVENYWASINSTNSIWSVINQDATKPPSGTVANGGLVESSYRIANVTRAIAQMRVDCDPSASDDTGISITFRGSFVTDSGSTFERIYTLQGGSGRIATAANSGMGVPNGINAPLNANAITNNGIYAGAGAGGTNWGNEYAPLLHMSRYAGSSQGQFQIDPSSTARVRGGNGTTWSNWTVLQAQGTSGRDFKKDITPADPKEALARIISQDLVTFVYKDDEQERVRFGFIAEDAEKIAPQYIKHDEETVEVDGEVITRDHPRVDTTPIVMDLMGCIHALQEQIEDLKFQIQELKK